MAGYLGANAPTSARELLRALAKVGGNPNVRFSAVELAGSAVLEWHESGEVIRAECVQHILDLLSDGAALEDSEPTVRALAGDVLSSLGDPRFDPNPNTGMTSCKALADGQSRLGIDAGLDD